MRWQCLLGMHTSLGTDTWQPGQPWVMEAMRMDVGRVQSQASFFMHSVVLKI